MADKDTITKQYMQDNEAFADVFNFLLYNGEQIIKPEQLKPLDTAAVAIPYGEDNRSTSVQKHRDILKILTVKEDDKATYMLLGIENQSDIHYAMPVRNMLYVAIQYASQVDETAKFHKRNGSKPVSDAEFLSGFYKTDKIHPVVTLTLYFGPDDWDAPRTLHEMLSGDNNNLMRFIPDYKLNLIAPAEIMDEDFSRFHTELSAALKYVKYSKDKAKLNEILQTDEAYKRVSRKTADMINVVTKSGLHYHEGEERVDMCKAIEEMRNDAIEYGKTEGIKEGIKEGTANGIIMTLVGLVKEGILSVADGAKRANMSVEDFTAKLNM